MEVWVLDWDGSAFSPDSEAKGKRHGSWAEGTQQPKRRIKAGEEQSGNGNGRNERRCCCAPETTVCHAMQQSVSVGWGPTVRPSSYANDDADDDDDGDAAS
jgi:hypothetical protein